MYGAALRGWTSYQEADIGPFETFIGGGGKKKGVFDKPDTNNRTEAHPSKSNSLNPLTEAQDEIVLSGTMDDWEQLLQYESLGGFEEEAEVNRLLSDRQDNFEDDGDSAEPEEDDKSEDVYDNFVGGLEEALKVSFDDIPIDDLV